MAKISQITHSQYGEIQDLFEVIGFPVRLEFQQIKEITSIERIKNKWDLQPDEKGVLVEMGGNGAVTGKYFSFVKAPPLTQSPSSIFLFAEGMRN